MSLPFKIYIRTTLQRTLDPSIDRELTQKGIPFELLVDHEHKPVESFLDQLEYISPHNSILLEDDVVLCRDFAHEVTQAITSCVNNGWGSYLINFFNSPSLYFTTHLSFTDFCYNQCTYYPAGLAAKIAKKMREIHARTPRFPYDTLEKNALMALSIPYVKYRPCLVQHLDIDTLVQKMTRNNRRTIYFKDYLDDLHITMDNATSHLYNLQKKFKEHFDTIEEKMNKESSKDTTKASDDKDI